MCEWDLGDDVALLTAICAVRFVEPPYTDFVCVKFINLGCWCEGRLVPAPILSLIPKRGLQMPQTDVGWGP
jgi:hypothetical protein